MSFTLEQVVQLISFVAILIGGGWAMIRHFAAELEKRDNAMHGLRKELEEARERHEKDMEEKLEGARRRSHDLASTMQAIRDDIQRKLDTIGGEFLRRDDFHNIVARFDGNVARVGDDVRMLSRRMDTMFTMISGKRAPPDE